MNRRRRLLFFLLFFGAPWLAVVALAVTAEGDVIEGFTEPNRRIELAAGEPGILTEIRVREGNRVRQSELVAALDTEVLLATLELARQRAQSDGALQGARAERDLRRSQLEQLQALKERSHATQRELERAETDYRIAQAHVVVAEEELRLQQLEVKRIQVQIERRQLRSPIDGVVSEVLREVGETFLAGDPRVMTIVQLDRLRVKFPASPSQSLRLTPGQAVSLTLPDSRQSLRGTVESISPVMDAKSGTIQVVVVIDNPREEIRSGARCLLVLPDSAPKEDLVRPSATSLGEHAFGTP